MKVHVARSDIAPEIGDGDKRFIEVVVRQPHAVKHGPVACKAVVSGYGATDRFEGVGLLIGHENGALVQSAVIVLGRNFMHKGGSIIVHVFGRLPVTPQPTAVRIEAMSIGG